MTKWPWVTPAPSGNGFNWYSTAEDAAKGVDLKGKTAVVTGANSGIGKETARVLAMHGCYVVCTSRSLEKGEEALKEMTDAGAPPENLMLMQLDLASLDSVRLFAESFKALGRPLHILVNNAGVMACPYDLTQDGFEMQVGTNCIGHFLLTNLLWENIKQAGKGARIVNVSSLAHHFCDAKLPQTAEEFDKEWFHVPKEKYDRVRQYGRSKLGNIWFANELQRRYGAEYGIVATSLHPGSIATNLGRHVWGERLNFADFLVGRLFKSPAQGAATSVFAACNPIAADYGGKHLDCCNVVEPTEQARDMNAAKVFWEACDAATNIKW